MTKLLQVLTHTPAWVFALMLLLLTLGVRQMRDTQIRPARLALLPLALTALSLWEVHSAFGIRPAPLIAWLSGAALALTAATWRPPSGISYNPASGIIQLPGSAAPLLFMMAIFFTKYTINATLAMRPELQNEGLLAVTASALYGSFSGLFAGRALRVVRYVHRSAALQR